MGATTKDVSLGEHYPLTWDEFVGQDPVKRQLRITAKSSRGRGVAMGHVLLASPVPGVGKTSLAMLTARELGGAIRLESGPIKAAQLPYMLDEMQDGDVLFLDEIHRLVQGGKGNAEWLLHLMENGIFMTPLGPQKAPKITVIASTTDAGRLPQPILDRFEICPTIVRYSDQEGAEIAIQLSRKILAPAGLCLPTPEVAALLTTAGNNSPRHIRRILCAVRDLVCAEEIAEAGGSYDLTEALAFAGVTADGLSSQAQKYLTIMVTEFHGNPAGKAVLADRLGEVGGGMTELEGTLLDKKLIALTRGGRVLTVDGMRRGKQLAGRG